MTMKTYQIQCEPVDSWFIRESRPHDAAGAARLNSLFPPPVRTLVGAVKTLIGNSLGVNWNALKQGDTGITIDGKDLSFWLGGKGQPAQLATGRLHLVREENGKKELLFPIPLSVLGVKDKSKATINTIKDTIKDTQRLLVRLVPGEPVHCDLGTVRLPTMATAVAGASTLEKTWVSQTDLALILSGSDDLDGIKLIKEKDLVEFEPRLGIGRDNQKGLVKEGMLYQTKHIRLKHGVSLSLEMTLPEQLAGHLGKTLAISAVHRFGGEGRMAHLSLVAGGHPLPKAPEAKKDTQGLMLMLLNDAAVAGSDGAPLAGFKKVQQAGVDLWLGAINGVELVLECCVIGKPVRRGGWDLQKSAPTAVRPLTPAGSCFFVRLADKAQSLDQAIKQLHGITLSTDSPDQQQGQILCGLWT